MSVIVIAAVFLFAPALPFVDLIDAAADIIEVSPWMLDEQVLDTQEFKRQQKPAGAEYHQGHHQFSALPIDVRGKNAASDAHQHTKRVCYENLEATVQEIVHGSLLSHGHSM
jgi:hypothetical protein